MLKMLWSLGLCLISLGLTLNSFAAGDEEFLKLKNLIAILEKAYAADFTDSALDEIFLTKDYEKINLKNIVLAYSEFKKHPRAYDLFKAKLSLEQGDIDLLDFIKDIQKPSSPKDLQRFLSAQDVVESLNSTQNDLLEDLASTYNNNGGN